MAQVALNGFLPSDYADGPVTGAVGDPPLWAPIRPVVEIHDARAFQGDSDPAAFFAEHGFVLLQHATRVRDWDADVSGIYMAEVDGLIRERLFPDRKVEVQQFPSLLRRGRDTAVPFYAEGVHSDGGRDADDYAHNVGAFSNPTFAAGWRARYDRHDVEGLVWVDFWRPTNMDGPLAHMPLALCDTASVDAADVVPTRLTGIAPEGRETHHTALRFNAGQRWYTYPAMREDEVLVFKLGGFGKPGWPVQNCFHSAFRDPDAPADAQERQSCEHRVGVLILRD